MCFPLCLFTVRSGFLFKKQTVLLLDLTIEFSLFFSGLEPLSEIGMAAREPGGLSDKSMVNLLQFFRLQKVIAAKMSIGNWLCSLERLLIRDL